MNIAKILRIAKKVAPVIIAAVPVVGAAVKETKKAIREENQPKR